jgi:hypothetical protein
MKKEQKNEGKVMMEYRDKEKKRRTYDRNDNQRKTNMRMQ